MTIFANWYIIISEGGDILTRSEIIQKLIKDSGFSMRSFAEKCKIPYTTLYSILRRGIGNASVDNVILICKNLGISVEQLDSFKNMETISLASPTYVMGANGDNEVKYSDSDISNIEAELIRLGVPINDTNYLISKDNVKTELTDNEYELLFNTLTIYRKK